MANADKIRKCLKEDFIDLYGNYNDMLKVKLNAFKVSAPPKKKGEKKAVNLLIM